MANKDKEFASIDKEVFAIAGLLDAQLRVAGLNAGEFSELEADYLKNWLNKEQDPLLGTSNGLLASSQVQGDNAH